MSDRLPLPDFELPAAVFSATPRSSRSRTLGASWPRVFPLFPPTSRT